MMLAEAHDQGNKKTKVANYKKAVSADIIDIEKNNKLPILFFMIACSSYFIFLSISSGSHAEIY